MGISSKNNSRRVFVRGADIIEALNISKKIKGKLHYIVPVSYDEYMRGVSRKYDES